MKNITYASNCTDQYDACRAYVWCLYSACMVQGQCIGAYIDAESFVYDVDHFLCKGGQNNQGDSAASKVTPLNQLL